MGDIKSLWYNSPLWAVLVKEFLCEFRTRYALSALVMFALVTLTSISMSLGGTSLSPKLNGTLLWVMLFFCSMVGLSRVFVHEQEAGTLFTLRLYVPSQAVLVGKVLFNVILLLMLTAFIIPLFVIFLNVEIIFWSQFLLVVLLGTAGIATISTFTAALIAGTNGKVALFTVVTFPLLLPQFLVAISATTKILSGMVPEMTEFIFLTGYTMAVMAAASILFDTLWYD
jgi:heme exporter protein B